MPEPPGAARLRRAYGLSVLAWALLVVPVDRTDLHLELRELNALQVAAVAFGMVGAAASAWLAAEYGPWSWWWPARAWSRYAAMACLGLATVTVLYAIVLVFRPG